MKLDSYPGRLGIGAGQGAWTQLLFDTTGKSWQRRRQRVKARRGLQQRTRRSRLEFIMEIIYPLKKLLQIVNGVSKY